MSAGTCGNRVRAVILDMDNTLFDLVGAKYAACMAIAREAGCGNAEDIFSYFLRGERGFEDPLNIRDFLEDHGMPDSGLIARCTRMYQEVKLARIHPYPEVQNTLRALREQGYPLALVTDAHRPEAVSRLEKTDLIGLFDHIVTHEATWQKKPSPVPFQYALKLLGVPPREVIAVGDSPRRDIAPCRQMGMITVYARYGDRFSQRGDRGGAHFAIDSLGQILTIINGVGIRERTQGYPCAADSRLP
ncbi:MAG: HAD family hydrolase [Methanolinea sp.]|nr:HAD family hydrolase [Methanolinea sp.]